MILLFAGKGTSGFSGTSGWSGLSGWSGKDGIVAGTNKQVLYNNNTAVGGAKIYYDNTGNGKTGFDEPTPLGTIDLKGNFVQNVITVTPTGGAAEINCSLGNYFQVTVGSPTTFTFSNIPATIRSYSFTLEIIHTGGTITFPAAVKWPDNTAPTFTAGTTRRHLTIFVSTTTDGARWFGAALPNYSF